jgi:hypothetical protein
METKPIFIVRIPISVNRRDLANVQEELEGRLPDYHALTVSCNVEDIQFECFNCKDCEEINYEELMEIIKQTWKTT